MHIKASGEGRGGPFKSNPRRERVRDETLCLTQRLHHACDGPEEFVRPADPPADGPNQQALAETLCSTRWAPQGTRAWKLAYCRFFAPTRGLADLRLICEHPGVPSLSTSDVPVAIDPIVAIVGGLCRSFLLGTSGMNLNLVELDVLHVEAYQIKEVLKVIFPSTLVRPCR